MPATVEDCVRSHTAWITLGASAPGGRVWREGGTSWAFVPGDSTVHGLFPVGPAPRDVAAATATADALGADGIRLWSAVERKRPWLRALGFRRAWQPWWMGAEAHDVPAAASGRVALVTRARDHDAGRAAFAGHQDVLLAEAMVGGEYAGRAWLHLDGEVAGLYDMEVWRRFQRRGLGRELLGTLVAEARNRGVRRVTLNATPEGAALYATCGFRMLGEGRTWWRG